jgi:hypothetical protein
LSSSEIGGDRDSIIEPIIPRESESVGWGEKPGSIGIEGSWVPMKKSEREGGCKQESTEINKMQRNTLFRREVNVTTISSQIAKCNNTQERIFSVDSVHLYVLTRNKKLGNVIDAQDRSSANTARDTLKHSPAIGY